MAAQQYSSLNAELDQRMELQAAQSRSTWEKEMGDPTRRVWHDETSVLLLGWEKALDDTGAGEEVTYLVFSLLVITDTISAWEPCESVQRPVWVRGRHQAVPYQDTTTGSGVQASRRVYRAKRWPKEALDCLLCRTWLD